MASTDTADTDDMLNRAFATWTITHDLTGILGRGENVCFRTQGAMFCRCPAEPGEFCVQGMSVYPQLGLIGSKTIGLFDIKHVPWGGCFWKEVLRRPYGVRRLTVLKALNTPMGWGSYFHMTFTGMDRTGTPRPCSLVCKGFGCRNGKSLKAHLWIIQRAVFRFTRKRLESRALAVMMATHGRIGPDSLLSMIPEDVIRHKILHPRVK